MVNYIKPYKKKWWNYIILYLFPVISYYGYGYIGFDPTLMKALYFISVPLMLIYVGKTIQRAKDPISKNVFWVLVAYTISIFMAYLFHEQSIVLGYRSTCAYFAFLYYFYLKKIGFSKSDINKLVIFYALLWVMLWLVGLYMAPIPIYGSSDVDLNEQRGIYRMFISGDGFLYLFFFMCINNGFIHKLNKLWKILACVLFVVIVLQVTRQTIIFSSLIAFYYVFRHKKHIIFYLAALALAINLVSIKVSENSVVGQLVNLSSGQIKDQRSGEDNARVIEYKYFLLEMPNNVVTALLGNGVPHDDSKFGKSFLNLKEMRKIYLSDVGYPALYVTIGFIGVFLMIKLWYISTKIRTDEYYSHMFLTFIFICNIVSFLISLNVITMSVALYLLQIKKKYDYT